MIRFLILLLLACGGPEEAVREWTGVCRPLACAHGAVPLWCACGTSACRVCVDGSLGNDTFTVPCVGGNHAILRCSP